MEPWTDPIVEEVRRIREEHAARFDFDLERMVRDAQRRERQLPAGMLVSPPQQELSWITAA